MEAQVWTLIALLGATLLGLLGSIFYLGQRIDSLGTRIDSLGTGLGGRIDGLAGRTDALSTTVEDQGRKLADRVYELGVKLDDHLKRHAV